MHGPPFGPPEMTCASRHAPLALLSTARSVGARTQRYVQRMMHTDLQLRAIAPMIRTPSQPTPTCRISKSLNLGERRSPTWSNGRYRPSSPLPASPCGSTRVCQREAYRAYCQHYSRLCLAASLLSRDPVSHLSFVNSDRSLFQARLIEPRNPYLHNCAFILGD